MGYNLNHSHSILRFAPFLFHCQSSDYLVWLIYMEGLEMQSMK
jgi:hypothetical protein